MKTTDNNTEKLTRKQRRDLCLLYNWKVCMYDNNGVLVRTISTDDYNWIPVPRELIWKVKNKAGQL